MITVLRGIVKPRFCIMANVFKPLPTIDIGTYHYTKSPKNAQVVGAGYYLYYTIGSTMPPRYGEQLICDGETPALPTYIGCVPSNSPNAYSYFFLSKQYGNCRVVRNSSDNLDEPSGHWALVELVYDETYGIYHNNTPGSLSNVNITDTDMFEASSLDDLCQKFSQFTPPGPGTPVSIPVQWVSERYGKTYEDTFDINVS